MEEWEGTHNKVLEINVVSNIHETLGTVRMPHLGVVGVMRSTFQSLPNSGRASIAKEGKSAQGTSLEEERSAWHMARQK